MIEQSQPIPFIVRVRDTNRLRYDYFIALRIAPGPIEPPPTPETLLYGDWDEAGAAVQGLYSTWHIEGAEVDVIYGNWS